MLSVVCDARAHWSRSSCPELYFQQHLSACTVLLQLQTWYGKRKTVFASYLPLRCCTARTLAGMMRWVPRGYRHDTCLDFVLVRSCLSEVMPFINVCKKGLNYLMGYCLPPATVTVPSAYRRACLPHTACGHVGVYLLVQSLDLHLSISCSSSGS